MQDSTHLQTTRNPDQIERIVVWMNRWYRLSSEHHMQWEIARRAGDDAARWAAYVRAELTREYAARWYALVHGRPWDSTMLNDAREHFADLRAAVLS